MAYAVIDQTTGDWFENIFKTKSDAIGSAEREWGNMSAHDKKRREAFYVAECELDEDGCINWETVKPIKEYCL